MRLLLDILKPMVGIASLPAEAATTRSGIVFCAIAYTTKNTKNRKLRTGFMGQC